MCTTGSEQTPAAAMDVPSTSENACPQKERAWAHFRSLGSPKFHVAPMVDQSELPFRMLCRMHGATAAYTPMFHARLFAEDKRYHSEVWTTCPEDRPLFVQFCANDPEHLIRAAKMVEADCDYVDLNLGCPQHIAKRGYYGSFLMDNLPLVEELVTNLCKAISTPVSVKIRVFSDPEATLAYARMIERAGACLLAVHGRTREQKDTLNIRADWNQIRNVKQALQIPVLANGNIRHLSDALACMEFTGCEGVLSADPLLEDPMLFSPSRLEPGNECNSRSGVPALRAYLENVLKWPVPMRMIKGHTHKLVGPWLAEFTDLRDIVNQGGLNAQGLLDKLVSELEVRIAEVVASGRLEPIAKVIDRAALKIQREEAIRAAIAEQEREAAALAALDEAKGVAPKPAPLPEFLSRHQKQRLRRKMGVGLASAQVGAQPASTACQEASSFSDCYPDVAAAVKAAKPAKAAATNADAADVAEQIKKIDLFSASDIGEVIATALPSEKAVESQETFHKGELVLT